jgi:anti-sigma factor RsiW
MLCHEFEDQLTDYLDGLLAVEEHRQFSEHALRCPLCHDLLGEVKNTLVACASSEAPPAGSGLEARILLSTMPETALTCEAFEDHLTDYLDGFLAAPLYHRWERHAALCENCNDLPGHVVRTIGACYTYLQDELPVPAGLEARILQETLGTVTAKQIRPSVISQMLEWLRGALDPIVSPQLASVATMLLVAVFVLTNTVSTDGSVGGIYHASLQLAERTAGNASKKGLPEVKQLAGSVNDLIEGKDDKERGSDANQNQNTPDKKDASQSPKSKPQSKDKSKGGGEQNNR